MNLFYSYPNGYLLVHHSEALLQLKLHHNQALQVEENLQTQDGIIRGLTLHTVVMEITLITMLALDHHLDLNQDRQIEIPMHILILIIYSETTTGK